MFRQLLGVSGTYHHFAIGMSFWKATRSDLGESSNSVSRDNKGSFPYIFRLFNTFSAIFLI